jgi:D-glycero-D-manno-heptose 1,7-bisphosphate phosphatase
MALSCQPSGTATPENQMVMPGRKLRPAVFLDRDGVIVIPEFRNQQSFAPKRVEDFRLYPEAAISLEKLRRVGFVLAVVTNQPDVGRGLTARSEVEAMHALMVGQLPLDTVKVCFHSHEDRCQCRKPKPGMILEAAQELSIDLRNSFMVGDRTTDMEAGRAAGCTTIFIDRGYAGQSKEIPDRTVHSIAEATTAILELTRNLSEMS